MPELVLRCECGLRVKAPGATPGRVGRCPRCGGRLRVPDEETPARPVVGPVMEPDAVRPGPRSRKARPKGPMPPPTATGGLLAPLEHPERGIAGSLVYPLRGAESMGVIGVLGVAIWMLGTAVPEYLASLMATAESTGHSLLGLLISLITSVPFLLLAPFVAFYWLSYLGRVLVSSSRGETSTPRTPDRDFDGFWPPLQPWAIWLFWGFGVGFAPAASVAAFAHPRTPAALWSAAGLGAIGFGYSLMALILSHASGYLTAVDPFAVIGSMTRTAIPFVGRCLVIAGLFVGAIAAFVATTFVRDSYFWIYLPMRFLGCASIAWASVVAMRILGVFAHRHRDAIRI